MYQLYRCRFSLIDIILCYRAEYVNFDRALDPFPALRRCQEPVMNRPLLRPFFDELIECRTEYMQMQANRGGIN